MRKPYGLRPAGSFACACSVSTLGWRPSIDPVDGLWRTIAWFRAGLDALESRVEV